MSTETDRAQRFDDAYRTVLGAARDGSLERDVDHDELVLSGRFGLDPVVLHAVLERLTDVGLVTVVADGTVRFGTLSVPAWNDNGHLLVGLMEGVLRSARTAALPAPAPTPSDTAEHDAVFGALRRAAALRTPDLDPAFWASLRFWIDRSPNAALTGLARGALERVRFGASPSVPFRTTAVEDWAAASDQALRYPSPRTAERAAHVLARVWDEQLTAVAPSLGVTPADLRTVTSAAADVPTWAAWQPDELWWDLLAMVRDGTLERGRTHPMRDVAARLRTSARTLAPSFRRLELMGLVERSPDGPDAVRIADPGVQHWVESLQLATTLTEMCARAAVPTLSADGRAELHRVVATVRQYARTRDYAFAVGMVELSRTLGRHTPNPWIAGNMRLAISRLAFVFDEAPPLRQWAVDDVLSLLDEAIDTGDPDLASAAVHALAVHYDAHVLEVTARWRPTP